MTAELEQEIRAMEAALDGESVEALLAVEGIGEGVDLEPEDRVEGLVVSLHREDVFVDIGGGRQGAVPVRQFGEQAPQSGTGSSCKSCGSTLKRGSSI